MKLGSLSSPIYTANNNNIFGVTAHFVMGVNDFKRQFGEEKKLLDHHSRKLTWQFSREIDSIPCTMNEKIQFWGN